MKPKRPRLKKGPNAADYCVEAINREGDKDNYAYNYFILRIHAREYAKSQHAPHVRVRIFRIKYALELDLK